MTNKFPRNAIAFKWKDETGMTKLIDVEWSASRTGLINPVAIINKNLIQSSSQQQTPQLDFFSISFWELVSEFPLLLNLP